mmetsp:Transcript_119319/g.332892  ORF Transcript_119319/g.332892 Transcript_119319/m.332892 type:complete len:140 (-) Transcript_119319:112-531(-)
MANHIHVKKMSDGSGRDTYIQQDTTVLHGKEQLGKIRVHSHKPFTHLELRGHPPLSAREKRRHTPSIRRGGPGWLPSIHQGDLRRMQESLSHYGGKDSLHLYPSAQSSPRMQPPRTALLNELQASLNSPRAMLESHRSS